MHYEYKLKNMKIGKYIDSMLKQDSQLTNEMSIIF